MRKSESNYIRILLILYNIEYLYLQLLIIHYTTLSEFLLNIRQEQLYNNPIYLLNNFTSVESSRSICRCDNKYKICKGFHASILTLSNKLFWMKNL